MKKNIIFIRVGYSYNSASFNRMQAIKKCLMAKNINTITLNIRVHSNKLPENVVWLSKYEFLFDNTKFKQIVFTRKEALSVYEKALAAIIGLCKTLQHFHIEKVNNSTVFLSSTSLFDYLFFFVLARIYQCKLVTDRSEYPHYIRKRTIFGSLYRVCFDAWKFKIFDGMLVISNELKNFYHKRLKKNAKLFYLPMTIDFSRFDERQKKQELYYIGYAGSLSSEKDGIHYLISAFNRVVLNYPMIELRIAGSSKNINEIEYLKSMSCDKVMFLGSIRREEIPQFLINAKILVLARPQSKQAQGGFPTKLGEYLASGVPTIVTKVGEITDYLTHKKDAYLIDPDSVDELFAAICEILNHYEKYLIMGKEGRETAQKYFNYLNYSASLCNYLMDLEKR